MGGDIKVVEVAKGAIDASLDRKKLGVAVVKKGVVDCKNRIVVDKEGDTTTTSATRMVATDDVEMRDMWVRVGGGEFSFLKGSNFNLMKGEEVRELGEGGFEAVHIELDDGVLNGRDEGTGVRVNVARG